MADEEMLGVVPAETIQWGFFMSKCGNEYKDLLKYFY